MMARTQALLLDAMGPPHVLGEPEDIVDAMTQSLQFLYRQHFCQIFRVTDTAERDNKDLKCKIHKDEAPLITFWLLQSIRESLRQAVQLA